MQCYPEVKVKVVHNSGESIPGMLLDGQVAIMISYTTINDTRIIRKKMFRNELLAIIPVPPP
ncbi:hypothetical protein [Mucilaginibacter sp. CSA2-8R]|uniref:hypothetical protein n=1 Tax=Mucilaginibacter sp. CSA2-8R TaxID=3141542 RepID=UPI00315DA912